MPAGASANANSPVQGGQDTTPDGVVTLADPQQVKEFTIFIEEAFDEYPKLPGDGN